MAAKKLKNWRIERDDNDLAWVYIDKKDTSTNVLSSEVLTELDEVINRLLETPPKGAVILSEKENGFIAGADVNEFTQVESVSQAAEHIRKGQDVFSRLESCPFPTLALIHGFCLGGGMELALSCTYRVALDDKKTRLGLPEVKLGIHPGFGGTVRLPPLIGGPAAMDMILTGRAIDARKAKKLGVVDEMVPLRHWRRAAVQTLLNAPKPKRAKGFKALTNNDWVRPILARFMRKKVGEKARPEHYPAPFAAIDLWSKYGGHRKRLMTEEAASLARLVMGSTAQNLIRVFFLQNQLKSLGDRKDINAQHVHVVGGGVMGGDIAAWCALQGMTVTVQDRNHKALARVVQRAHKLYKRKLKHPRLIRDAMDRLIPDVRGAGIPKADVIIEAIFEDLKAKQALFKDLEAKAKPDALLATNTSSIPLEQIGEALDKPERLVGIHFFNPVAQMQLVEIVKADNTNTEELKRAAAFTRCIDRLPLTVKSSPGFLVNRVLMPYLLEAVILESEGVPAALIDEAALEFGMPMGPLHLADTVGLDICLSVSEILSQRLNIDIPERLRELTGKGHLGVKTGNGFYRYVEGKPQKPFVENAPMSKIDISDRLISRLHNEAMACLREGVVENADLLDAGIVFGTGFAPFRGGPMHDVKSRFNDKINERFADLEARYGERFHADPGWSNA